jgi:hypothetical protein
VPKIAIPHFTAHGILMEGRLGAAVPSIVWDAFEEALHTNMYRLAKDIAMTLGQPNQPLLDAIKANKVRPFLVEMNEDRDISLVCDYICQRPDAPAILQPCGQVVLWGIHSRRCPQHMYSVPGVSHIPSVKAIQVDDQRFYVSEDGTIYDGSYTIRGTLTGKTVKIFEVDKN